MDTNLLKRWITRWEGRRNVAYDDKTGSPLRPGLTAIGNPSIGVGCNLNTTAARSIIDGFGLDFNQVITGAVTLTDAQIDALRDSDIGAARNDARALVPGLDQMPDHAQIVVIDLSFNMGKEKLSEFHITLGQVKAQNWVSAAGDLRASLWFREAGPLPNERGGADVALLSGTTDAEAILALR